MTRIRKFALFLATLVFATTWFVAAGTTSSEAQTSNFDRELIRLANQHRASIGRAPLTASGSISASSLQWSRTMLSTGNFRHDPNLGFFGENIAYSMGVVGTTFNVTWNRSAGALPGYCTNRMDYTTPKFTMCQWLSSSGHRRAIESTSYRQIGTGTAIGGPASARKTYSTMRFSTAPATPVVITAPANGSRLPCTNPTVSFSGPDSGRFAIHAGSSPTTAEYKFASTSRPGSMTLDGLPQDGSLVYVRLYHQPVGSGWKLMASHRYVDCGSPSAFTGPVDGDVVCGSTTLRWTGPSSGRFAVHAGTSPTTAQYVFTSTTAKSLTVNSFPSDGSEISVRLWHQPPGRGWKLVDSVRYRACAGPDIQIVSPTPGTTLRCGSATVTWSGPTSGQYAVHAGTSPTKAQYAFVNVGSQRSATLRNLPSDGSPVSVRIWHRTSSTSRWTLQDSETYRTC